MYTEHLTIDQADNRAGTSFSNQAIRDQLDRIFLHPHFTKSTILKNFLSYVVNETLTGNAGFLKEYTIAVKVLQKPPSFNPQKSGIVRIHAVRLRNALDHYYNQTGNEDEIIIGIPKGKYVPVFVDRKIMPKENKSSGPSMAINFAGSGRHTVTLAILPFACLPQNNFIRSFSDNLCLQICSALAETRSVAVIAYQATRGLWAAHADLRELASLVGSRYIITGGAQLVKRTVRVNIQLVDCCSYRQVWSRLYEYPVSDTNIFEIQDQLCRNILVQALSQVEK